MPAKWVHRYELKPGRWIFEPTAETRAEGVEVKMLVESYWQAPLYYYHLKRGGHIAALRRHQKNSYFFKVDIGNFFGSISRSRVSRSLKEYISHIEARKLATASTVHDPANISKTILPYGFIQSPLLASLVLHKSSLGVLLDVLNKDKTLVVTVYVDDIIVSSNNLVRLTEISRGLKERAKKSGFAMNSDKDQGPANSIIAFNIHLTAGKELSIVASRFLELSELFDASTNDFQKAGLLSYIQSVSTLQAEDFQFS